MTLSSSVGTARARAASPAGALELDLQDKKKKRKTEKTPPQPLRSLIDISATPTPPHPLLSSFIQSTPLLICFPWWEEIYQDAVSLTSLSDWDRNRISKCLTGLRGFIFKPPPPLPSSCTNLCLFKKVGEAMLWGGGGGALRSTPVWGYVHPLQRCCSKHEIDSRLLCSTLCSAPLAWSDL